MEILFLSLQKQLADNMPEIALIDEDYGQLNLQNEEDTYPVTFPCVLIAVREVQDWKNLAGASQRGELVIDFKLPIDSNHETHYNRNMSDHHAALIASKPVERIQLSKKVHKLLQNFSGKILLDESGEPIDKYFSPLKRSSSIFYTMPRGIKVYEQSYKTALMDIIG